MARDEVANAVKVVAIRSARPSRNLFDAFRSAKERLAHFRGAKGDHRFVFRHSRRNGFYSEDLLPCPPHRANLELMKQCCLS